MTILTEYVKKRFICLTRLEQVVYFYIENSQDFPLFIPDICKDLRIARSTFTPILKNLLKYDLVDVIEYPNFKEIYRKGYLDIQINLEVD